jgi:excisionase family DNA binding protein
MSAIGRLLDDLSPDELADLARRLQPFLERADDRLLTPSEAATRLGLHPKTITRAARAGRVRGAVQQGRSWRFRAEELHLNPPTPSSTSTSLAPAPLPRPRGGATSTADAIRGTR